ncbi:UNVERIFIED_CONTAM: hypothetical protein ABID98_004642 [Brevibacillus sp. OAP136]
MFITDIENTPENRLMIILHHTYTKMQVQLPKRKSFSRYEREKDLLFILSDKLVTLIPALDESALERTASEPNPLQYII